MNVRRDNPLTGPLDMTTRGRIRLRSTPLRAGAVLGIAIGIAAGWGAADLQRGAATAGWHGRVAAVGRAGADRTTGLTLNGGPEGAVPAGEGAELVPGAVLATDA